MVRCLALADGLVGTHYVRAGEEFLFDGPVPRWARPLTPAAEEKKPAAEKKPAKKKPVEGEKKAGK